MLHRVFVYGTLLRGEVNHHLLAGAAYLGPHRTAPHYTLVRLGAYPGLVAGGQGAVHGEVFRVDDATLRTLDRLEDYPRLYDRRLIPTAFGSAWVYLYRGSLKDRARIRSGDWRTVSAAGAVRNRRDPKNPARRTALHQLAHPPLPPTPDPSGPQRDA